MPLRAVRFLAAALLVVTASAAELTVESGGSINLMGCGSGGVGAAGLSTALDATAEHIIASLSPPTPPASAAPSLAEAATATHDFTDHDGVEFTVYEFQVGAHQFQVPAPMEVDVLIVAGGGGTAATTGGGGGAGGVVHLEGKALDAKKTYTVKVGAGGNGGGTLSKNNMNGKDSFFDGVRAIGGGHGSQYSGSNGNDHAKCGRAGGSGGGSGYPSARCAPAAALQPTLNSVSGVRAAYAFGHPGGLGDPSSVTNQATCGGGGGAGSAGGPGAPGVAGGDGGIGVDMSDLFGPDVGEEGYFGGGGGGGRYDGANSKGGLGGGGGGGGRSAIGYAHTGGGAMGAFAGNTDGYTGGSGVVLVRVPK